jgi:hypothetical protein
MGEWYIGIFQIKTYYKFPTSFVKLQLLVTLLMGE